MRIEFQRTPVSVPDFLIVGAPRCGTSTLFNYLNSHPDIYIPWEKEPMFFSSWKRPLFREISDPQKKIAWITRDPWEYFHLFQKAPKNQILGEASTWYLYDHAHVIPNIKSLYGNRYKDLKIVILLRDPVDRAWSHYTMYRSERREDLDFAQALQTEVVAFRKKQHFSLGFDYKGFGFYFCQVKAYLECFEKVQIHIFEDFFRHPETKVPALYDFLTIAPQELTPDLPKANVSGIPRSRVAEAVLDLVYRPNIVKTILRPLLPTTWRRPLKYRLKKHFLQKDPLDPDLRASLGDEYRQDTQQLERLLGRDLSLWSSGTDSRETM